MSGYNRRSTRNTAAPPTQVTYHQNTGRPAVPTQQPQVQQQQQQQQQQFQLSQAQYQQQTPIKPQQAQPQIQQVQQQQVQQAAAVYKSPAPQTPVKPVQPQTPQANQLTPKMEPNTPMKTVEATAGDGEMDAEGGETKKWQKRPKPQGYKVNKVLKRRRKNARFRKLLTPKNAIMVLNELHPGVAFDSREVTNAFNQTTYIVSFEVEGQQFSGEGTSKGAAKQAAAEAAVKSLILKKIADSKKREESAEPMDTTENAEESQSEAGDGTTNGGRRRELPEDEVPWGSLASFALFRLFNEWESQGTYVPFPAGAIPKVTAAMATVAPINPIPKTPKKPANVQGTHPVTLVGRLWPGSIFTELSRDGQPPNMTFVMGVSVDGKSFTGTAKNKKDAKKECAKAALAGMGVQWEEQVAQTV